jgi:hypothetical protein
MFLPPDLLAGVAKERHATLLAEAAADRRARQARLAAKQARREARLARRETGQARRAAAPRPSTGLWLARLVRPWRPERRALAEIPRAHPLSRDAPAPARLPVILRDGSQVLIRPVQDSDRPLLPDGFGRLSDKSRWMRFRTAKRELTPVRADGWLADRGAGRDAIRRGLVRADVAPGRGPPG